MSVGTFPPPHYNEAWIQETGLSQKETNAPRPADIARRMDTKAANGSETNRGGILKSRHCWTWET